MRAVAGACGSFAYYQLSVAEALKIPVFLSIMMQVPFIQQAMGMRKKLCIVCAAASSLNARVFEQCKIPDTSNLVIREMKGHPEFDELLNGSETIDPYRLSEEVVAVCKQAVQDDNAIAAFLLQCSDLPTFGPEIQNATGLPVFDMTLLIRWLQFTTLYLPYSSLVRGSLKR